MITDTGLTLLICEIIRCTAQDLHFGSVKDKKTAEEFIDSEWFGIICESGLRVDPYKLRKVMKVSTVRRRHLYE